MNTTNHTLISILYLTVMLLFSATANAAPPVRDKILDDVQLVRNDEQLTLQVRFSLPMRYRSHFPQDRGNELRIQLHPIRIPASDLNAVPRREGVVPLYADSAAIDEVIYEGDIEGGPYLTVRFTRPVGYQIIPGSDYRSINIIIQ
jgi:hypothetical protein